MSLSPQEKELATEIGFDPEVLLIVKEATQSEINRLHREINIPEVYQEYFFVEESTFAGKVIRLPINEYQGEAVQIIVDDEVREYEGTIIQISIEGFFVVVEDSRLFLKLQSQLAAKNYLAFTIAKDYPNKKERIGVIKGNNQYDIITIQMTGSANYGIKNIDIVNKLKQWEEICDFKIVGASYDWLDLEFINLPEDINYFAADVYKFCPDTIYREYLGSPLGENATIEDLSEAIGKQTVADLAAYLKKEKRLWLWWD